MVRRKPRVVRLDRPADRGSGERRHGGEQERASSSPSFRAGAPMISTVRISPTPISDQHELEPGVCSERVADARQACDERQRGGEREADGHIRPRGDPQRAGLMCRPATAGRGAATRSGERRHGGESSNRGRRRRIGHASRSAFEREAVAAFDHSRRPGDLATGTRSREKSSMIRHGRAHDPARPAPRLNGRSS